MINLGVILRWKIPNTDEVSYDKTYIYRATSIDGNYEEIASQSISDNTYFDIDGSESYYYKIRFYDSVNDKWSLFSEPMQGGEFFGYCSIDDIRLLTGIPSTVTDSELYDLQIYAQAQVNKDISVMINDEQIEYISKDKPNMIDGVNTTFYVQYPRIGDLNDDGAINYKDIELYSIDSSGNRDYIRVSSVNEKLGSFTVAEPLTPDKSYYVNYRSTPVCLSPPDILVKQATAYLVGSLAYSHLDIRDASSFRVGKIAVTRQQPAASRLMDLYNSIVHKIKSIACRAEAENIV